MHKSHGHILLGISGGIAAYKSAELVRLLRREGFDVVVIMTAAAQKFVAPLTFQALSGNPVHSDLLDPTAEAGMGHIALARWADLLLIAPASANILASIATGHASDLLTTVCLASQAPLVVAPAMNQAMWGNPATQHNIQVLSSRNISIWGPGEGEQACGDTGFGRMLDPGELLARTLAQLNNEPLLQGKHLVITAGPTREAIDPVRYLSNHSSGKMGYALAAAAQQAGATVDLVSGPTHLDTPRGVIKHSVNSADEMLESCLNLSTNADIFIAAAAVSDFHVDQIAQHKLKKQPGQTEWTLQLRVNPDILATVANLPNRPFCVGFAAETQDLLSNARKKLTSKNVAMIIANDVANKDIGFNSQNNAVTVVTQSQTIEIAQQQKVTLAQDLIQIIAAEYNNKRTF